MPAVYLLHFDRPLAGGRQPRHYLGWTGKENLRVRLERHARGNGACIIANGFRPQGIGFTLVRTWWRATRATERTLKRHHNPARMCPICNPSTRAMVVVVDGRVVHRRVRMVRPRVRFTATL